MEVVLWHIKHFMGPPERYYKWNILSVFTLKMTYRTRFVDKSNSANNRPIKDHTHQHNHIPTTYKNITTCQQSTGYCGVLVFNFRKKCSLQRLRSSKRRKMRLPCVCNTLWHSFKFWNLLWWSPDTKSARNEVSERKQSACWTSLDEVVSLRIKWVKTLEPIQTDEKTHNVAYSPGCRSRAMWLTNM